MGASLLTAMNTDLKPRFKFSIELSQAAYNLTIDGEIHRMTANLWTAEQMDHLFETGLLTNRDRAFFAPVAKVKISPEVMICSHLD